MKKKLLCLLLPLVLLLSNFPKSTYASYSPDPTNLIPAMTNYSSPSGKVTASRELTVSPNCLAWEAFDHLNKDHYEGEWLATNFDPQKPDWIAYEFPEKMLVNKYTITSGHYTYSNRNAPIRAPKKWLFQGSQDGQEWVTLDSQKDITDWKDDETRSFEITNKQLYKIYRLYILETNGDEHIAIGEIEMMNVQNPEPTSTPTPTLTPSPTATSTPTATPSPTVTASPTPEQPIGDRAILVVTMNTGLEKEFDLPMSEVNDFINWYDTASGSARYGINKHDNNKGPFSKRTEYVVHDKILTFEVSEYTTK